MNIKRAITGDKKNEEDSFILESCPNGGFNCQFLLKHINEIMAHARDCIVNKDYQKALDLKSRAFQETIYLEYEQCLPCTHLFRDIIIESVNNLVLDLQKMTSGIFRNNKFETTLQQAEALLDKMKIEQLKSERDSDIPREL